jgi:hypothetical protein
VSGKLIQFPKVIVGSSMSPSVVHWWCSGCGFELGVAPVGSTLTPCPCCGSTARQSWPSIGPVRCEEGR